MGDGASEIACEGKGVDACPRRAGRRASPDAMDGNREGLRVRGPGGESELARSVRRPPTVDRLPRFFRTRCERLARTCLRWLLNGGGPGRQPRALARTQYNAGICFARATAGDRTTQGADGLVYALVHYHGRVRQKLRC